MILNEFTIQEAIAEFPEILALNFEQDIDNKQFDFYMTALGFEERTLSIPEKLQQCNGFRCDELIFFTYGTSTNDNAFNEPRLRSAFDKIKNKQNEPALISNVFCDEDSFFQLLCSKLENRIKEKLNQPVDVIIDLSVCSSKLILTLLKIIFQIRNITLKIVYTEALTYFPLYEEYASNPEHFLEESQLSTTRGHEKIVNSNEYSEGAKENSDLIVAFAPFKVGRINKIVSEIDESILLNNDGRLEWIIGDPNFDNEDDKRNRIKMLKDINRIPDATDCKVFEVSTLNYKETILKLEDIYQCCDNFHINIADLGSKMQTIGISIFYHIRPDVSVYYALPLQYNSHRYSQGFKKHWQIDFGNFNVIIDLIKRIDNISIDYSLNDGYPRID